VSSSKPNSNIYIQVNHAMLSGSTLSSRKKTVQLLVDEWRRINILCGSKEEHINIQRDLIPVTCFSKNRASQERPSHDVTIYKLYCHMSASLF